MLFLHLFSYFVFFFFSYFLTYNFNGQTVGNHGSTETYWWLWVTSLNHISKESHKDGSRDGMWSTTMYWFSAYKLLSAGIFFLSGPDKGFMLDQITKASFLNELLYTDLLVSSSLFFLCCSKWSHQLLHCAWGGFAHLVLLWNFLTKQCTRNCRRLMNLTQAFFTLEWARMTRSFLI